jgi:hypothetical protein
MSAITLRPDIADAITDANVPALKAIGTNERFVWLGSDTLTPRRAAGSLGR